MAPDETAAPPGVLLADDVARLWNDEARKKYQTKVDQVTADNAARARRGVRMLPLPKEPRAITAATVIAYARRFKGSAHPMPEPAGRMGTHRRLPWWFKRQEKDLRAWYRNRPGHGHGRGGRYAGAPRRTPATPAS